MNGRMFFHQRLIHQAVAIPAAFLVMRLRQGNGLTDEAAEGIGLWQRLAVELVNPLWRTIGRDDDERTMLIICLCHSRSEVQQRRTTGDTNGDWLSRGLRHTQGIETC